MATAEKTKEQQKQFQVPEYDSEEDYDSADDIEYSEDEKEDQTAPNKNQQLQRRRRPLQQQDDPDDYSSDDYDSEEYDDDEDYSDDEIIQGKSMQPWSQGTTSSMAPSGGMNVVPQEQKKSLDDEEGMKLKLELNLEIEIELKARIHGDLTLALM
ncbi:uncharacterized protein N7458_008165 [Penicillium daleae]|jgi:hypothetical protein|uniref:Uncharacterized protein n=1 Tax=Penicillium daleae TaxID=63821 RepID=A0AAD6C4U7_9EURO|nr:uncharacterized protein N7458_008165 [Penicillium daleae]KAJ5444293.1 hypothetical protein N7458_008165 [Penicillium daleae]